jgi:hypothetical protein
MRPGRKCKICSAADPMLLAKVDALLESGETYRTIASLTGFDRFSIQRHKRHAFPQAEAEPENLGELELSEKRLASLASRLEQQYTAAISCGDNKVALDVTKVLARVETERHNRIVDRKQAEIDNDLADPIKAGAPSAAYMDWIKNKVRACYAKQIAVANWAWCPMGCGKPVDPKIIPERIRIYLEAHAHDSAITN